MNQAPRACISFFLFSFFFFFNFNGPSIFLLEIKGIISYNIPWVIYPWDFRIFRYYPSISLSLHKLLSLSISYRKLFIKSIYIYKKCLIFVIIFVASVTAALPVTVTLYAFVGTYLKMRKKITTISMTLTIFFSQCNVSISYLSRVRWG